MVKIAVLLVNIIGVLFLNFFLFNNVTLEMNTPEVVVAGEEFEVEVTVKKGYLTSFARFEQNLPAGLSAESVESAHADFSYDNKRVRLIWLRLPSEENFTFKYKIKVDERLKGDFFLSGKFSFIDENARRHVEIKPKLIFIEPSPHIDESLVVDIDEFESLVLQELNPTETKRVACIRQKPEVSALNEEIIVRLLVNKEDKEKFAKIEEEVPEGFTAISMDTKDGIFTFKDNKAKFLWMNLPLEKYFVVSYKLIPEEGTSIEDYKDMDGVFSFIEEDRTIPIRIVEREFNVDDLTPVAVESILSTVPEIEELMVEPEVRKVIQPDPPPVDIPDVDDSSTEPVDVVPEPSFSLSVISGNGSGEYKEGEPVMVYANPPGQQEEFDYWSGDNEFLASSTDPETRLTMPARDVEISATYKEIPTPLVDNNTNKTKETGLKYSENDLPNLLEPEEGVYYRVQIAAGHKPVNINWYFKRLNIQDDVRTEIHNNWIKYSIGSYSLYREARDYRVHIWNTTTVDDAFVAAYNDGVRITVQEALMIANQQWYK